jgi:Flp pilus assembly protein TadD
MKIDSRLERYALIGSMILIVGLTLFVYWPTQEYEFVNFDDDGYITNSRIISLGYTLNGIKEAFTNTEMCNWHPVTWLSHMGDWQLYRLNAGGHHWTSVQIHAAATVTLFAVMSMMTGSPWASALVAALFSLHPLHVESVAWVSERKDVLSALLMFFAILSYAWYVRKPLWSRYLLVFVLFGFGLMSKPMLVTFPFMLLLLDYWPLCRMQRPTTWLDRWAPDAAWLRLLMEKAPLMALSAIASAITLHVQGAGECVVELIKLPLQVRLSNAVVAYVEYIRKMIWPVDLAVFYPHTGMPSLWEAVGAMGVLAVISMIVARYGRRYPFLPVGWCWYLGTLVPVIGIVQVGSQALADRYTYIPLVGLFIMISWGLKAVVEKVPKTRILLCASVLGAVAILTVLTAKQVGVWRDSFSLFSHALEVTKDNKTARNNLGVALINQHRLEEALPYFFENLRRKNPDDSTYYNAAICLAKLGRCDESDLLFREAVRLNPRELRARADYAGSLIRRNNAEKAEIELREILRINPKLESAYFHLASLAIIRSRYQEAEVLLKEVLRIKPDSVEALNNMGAIYLEMGDAEKAIPYLERASELVPGNEATQKNLIKANSKKLSGPSAQEVRDNEP